MRIGLTIRPTQGSPSEAVSGLASDASAAEAAGFSSIWVAQTPTGFDALTAVSVMAQATDTIEIGTAVLPIQTRHPFAMAQNVLSVQAVAGGRLTLGLGVSHAFIVTDMLGLPYTRPAADIAAYLDVLRAALAGSGRVDVDNDFYHVHAALDIPTGPPTPIMLAALAPTMLRLAGECTTGTILWMADEQAISDHIVPRISEAAAAANRPSPRVVAGVPITLCRAADVADAQAHARSRFGYAEVSPNYQRLLARGARRDVAEMLVCGDEEALVERLRGFARSGSTDLNAIVLPFGTERESQLASQRRTEAFLASITPELNA